MKRLSLFLSGVLFLAMLVTSVANATLLGPSPYLSFSDSPFSGGSFDYFYLEDFEDHSFNVPGVSASTGGVTTSFGFSGTIIDSVDFDDGSIDGACTGCDSYFSSSGSAGISFTFDATALGSLPTSVGIVWTDGAADIFFEAFNADNQSLGILIGTHADSGFHGGTAEDRFYGVTDLTGISSILISNLSGGIEVDHLQYGLASSGGGGGNIPEPTTLALMGLGLAGIGWRRKKVA